MKNVFISTIIAMMAVSIGLYAQEKDQEEPVQTEEIRLELVWEKEIQSTVKDDWPYPGDLVFLDENGYNVFSSQCEHPEKVLKEKRILMICDGKIKWLEGDDMKIVKEMEIGESSSPNGNKVVISKNGRNIAIIEGLERYKYEEIIENNVPDKNPGDFKNTHATIRLLNWQGDELARTQIPIEEWDYIDLFPLGNDKTIALNFTGGEGRYHECWVFIREGNALRKVFSKDGFMHDYSETGDVILITALQGTRFIVDGEGKTMGSYIYKPSMSDNWAGVSPKGDYIAEVIAGMGLVIHDHYGRLITKTDVSGRFGTFSPDGKYLCITPGPKQVYFLETKSGKMLWEYVDMDEKSYFSSLGVISSALLVFAGHSEAILNPGEFKGTIDELNKKVIENATKDRTIYIVKNGKFLKSFGLFPGEGFGTQLQAPAISLSADEKFLLAQTPSKSFIYRIYFGGEQ